MPFFRGSSWPRNRAQVSCIAGRFLTGWATRERQKLGPKCQAWPWNLVPWAPCGREPVHLSCVLDASSGCFQQLLSKCLGVQELAGGIQRGVQSSCRTRRLARTAWDSAQASIPTPLPWKPRASPGQGLSDWGLRTCAPELNVNIWNPRALFETSYIKILGAGPWN